VFSCSKIEQKQLNTWVSFQSAEQPLLGQFSVSGNKQASSALAEVAMHSIEIGASHLPSANEESCLF